MVLTTITIFSMYFSYSLYFINCTHGKFPELFISASHWNPHLEINFMNFLIACLASTIFPTSHMPRVKYNIGSWKYLACMLVWLWKVQINTLHRKEKQKARVTEIRKVIQWTKSNFIEDLITFLPKCSFKNILWNIMWSFTVCMWVCWGETNP